MSVFKRNDEEMYRRFESLEEGYQLDFQEVSHATWDAQEGGRFKTWGDKTVLPGVGWFQNEIQIWCKAKKQGLMPEEAKQKFCPCRNGNCVAEGCMGWVVFEDYSGRCGMMK